MGASKEEEAWRENAEMKGRTRDQKEGGRGTLEEASSGKGGN